MTKSWYQKIKNPPPRKIKIIDLWSTSMWQDVHEAVEKTLIYEGIQKILSSIPEVEHFVLLARWFHGYDLKEISKKLKVGPDKVRQIERKALQRLKRPEFRKEFSKFGFPWIEFAEKRIKQEELEREKTYQQIHLEWLEENLKRARELEIQREAYKPLKPIEVPLIGTKEKPPERRSTFPPKQVSLRRDAEDKHYLWIDPWLGSIERGRDPQRYDEWLEWLLKNEHSDTEWRREVNVSWNL